MTDLNTAAETLTLDWELPASELEKRYSVIHKLAKVCAASRMVPKEYRNSVNDCFVAIQMGAELGLPPFQAIQFIAPIPTQDGIRPTLWGDGLIAVVRGSGKCEFIEEWLSEDGKVAYCKTRRRGELAPVTREYSLDRASKNGLLGKPMWKKDPARMLQMRARAFCLRDVYADVLKGMGVAEEVMDYDSVPPQEAPAGAEPHVDPVQKAAAIDSVSLDEVLSLIEAAEDMPALLLAGDRAKILSEEDRTTARAAYSARRAQIKGDGNA